MAGNYDGKVVYGIEADTSGIDKSVKQVTNNIQSESKKWDQAASQATGEIEKSFASMAGNIIGKLAAAGITTFFLNVGKEAINLASDLEEVQNVVDTTFGEEGSKKIDKWAKNASNQFGLTETQAKKFSSTIGAMMKSSGLAGDEIVSMSTDLAGLAADMASFYNLDFEEAFDKIKSGMSGMTMPLKSLGIDMSVASLEAFALEQGLGKTYNEMSNAEQTMLRYKYLMKATADSQGDFARTSDGYANGIRKLSNNIDGLKAKLGSVLLDVINPILSGINQLFTAPEEAEKFSILDRVEEININKETKLAEIRAVASEAKALVGLLDEIGKETTISANFEIGDISYYLAQGTENEEAIRQMEELGLATDEINEKQAQWLKTVQGLEQTIPGLSSMINTSTGEVQGGIPALTEYVDEWQRMQEIQAEIDALDQLNALYLAENNLASKKADYIYKRAQAAIKIQNNAPQDVQDLLEYYGVSANDVLKYIENAGNGTATEWQAIVAAQVTAKLAMSPGSGYQEVLDYVDALNVYQVTLKELPQLQALIEEQQAELNQELEDAGLSMDDFAHSAAAAADVWDDTKQTNAKTALENAKKSFASLADYVDNFHNKVKQAVNGVIKGFADVQKAGESLREKQASLASEYAKTEIEYAGILAKFGGGDEALQKMSDNWDKLTDEEQEAYNALAKIRNEQAEVNKELNQYKPEGMKANLESQIKFMNEYLDNLEWARNAGLSDELIASLSDGSQASAEYLAGLREGGEDAAQEVDALYKQVQEKKEEFTNSLADQQLTVDETYNKLLEAAKEAVAGLNLEQDAKDNAGATVQGLVDGINAHVPDVADAVDAVLAELSRLNFFGINFALGNDGKEVIDGEFATGLNYVPFDGFLASLHQGEGILTAEENRIWQRFKNGQNSGVDYDALGGVMRDNIQTGGNVYLDGRTVGQVVSDIQGNQYRSLQRSGWMQ